MAHHNSRWGDLLPNRVDVSFIGNNKAKETFKGQLIAHAPAKYHSGKIWLDDFSSRIQAAVGKINLPVYRMADGEFRFLAGRRIDWGRKPLLREILSYSVSKILPRRSWTTSWGETYPPEEVNQLRGTLLQCIREIASTGLLAIFLYTNGLRAYEHYNKTFPRYLARHNIHLTGDNYVPFHFPVEFLLQMGHRGFFSGRSVLVASSLSCKDFAKVETTLKEFGSTRVEQLTLSPTNALKDKLKAPDSLAGFDIALVAAGIGAANIICQLTHIKGPVIDIGGFINCLVDPTADSHLVFKLNAYRV